MAHIWTRELWVCQQASVFLSLLCLSHPQLHTPLLQLLDHTLQAEHAKQVQVLNTELSEARASTEGTTSRYAELEAKLAAMTALVAEKDKKIDAANDELQQCDIQARQMHTDLECALQRGDQYDMELKQLTGRDELLKERDDLLKDREAQLRQRDQRIAKMSAEISALQVQLKAAQDESSSTAGSMSAARAEFDSERDVLHDETAAAKAELAKVQRKMSAAARELRAQWDSDRILMVEQHTQELAKARTKSASSAAKTAITDAQNAAEAAVNALRAQLTDVEQAATKAEAERDELRASLVDAQAKAHALEEAATASTSKLAAQLQEAQTHSTEQAKKMEALNATVQALQVDKDGLEESVKGLDEELAGLRSELSSLSSSISSNDTALSAERGKFDQSVEDLKRQHAGALAHRKDLEDKLNEKIRALHARAADLQAAHARALLDIKLAEDTTAAKQIELDRMQQELDTAHSSKLADLMSAHADGVDVLQQEVDSLKSQHTTEIAALTNKHGKEMVDLRASVEDELANAAYEHKKTLIAATDASKKQVELARVKCMKDANVAHNTLKDEHASQLTKQAAAFAEQLEARLAQEIATRKTTIDEQELAHNALLATLTKEQHVHKEQLDAARSQLVQSNSIVASLEADLQSNRSELEGKGKELLTCRSEGLQQLHTREEELRAQQQNQMEALVQSYRDQFAKAKEEACATQNSLELKISIFKEELNNAQERFRNRAPRDEDMTKIQELEQQLSATVERVT